MQLLSFLSGDFRDEIKIKKIQYTMVILLGGYHLLLIPLYWILFGKTIMTTINIFSVFIYILSFICAKKKKYDIVYYLCLVEVIGYYIVATYMFGVESGFHLYLMAVIAVCYFASYNFSTPEKKITVLPYLFVCFAAFLFSSVMSWFHKPVLVVPGSASCSMLVFINFLTCAGALILFLGTFLSRIHVLENHLIKQNKEFKKMSMYDALTGLMNRRYLAGKYEELDVKETKYSVIIADIDDFKKVNDTYGHETGDRVLVKVADIFKEFVRDSDYVCRWGGEEILVLMPYCTKSQAKRVGAKLLEAAYSAEVKGEQGEKVKISITMGLADSTEGDGFMDVFRLSDHRLYQGKRSGKNCIVMQDNEKEN